MTSFQVLFPLSTALLIQLSLATRLGQKCSRTAQCTSGKGGLLSMCKNSVCACVDSAVPLNGVCYSPLKVQERCHQDEECSAGLGIFGECFEGTCTCSEGSLYDYLSQKCDPVPVSPPGFVRYGQECRNLSDCMGDPFTSSCYGRCSCVDGYTPSSRLDNCLRIVPNFGGPCTDSQQCQKGKLGQFAGCRKSKCGCGLSGVYHVDKETCIQKAFQVGDECDTDLQCTAGLDYAVCIRGICICMEGAKKTHGKCVLNNMSS